MVGMTASYLDWPLLVQRALSPTGQRTRRPEWADQDWRWVDAIDGAMRTGLLPGDFHLNDLAEDDQVWMMHQFSLLIEPR